MKEMEEDMGLIFKNYASPMMMFHFEDAGEQFIKNQASAIKKALPGSKLITDKKFDVQVFETNPNAKYDKYIEHLQNDVVEPGTQFPIQLINAGFTARAASETTDSVIIRKVKRIQKRLVNQIIEEMIIPYLRGIGKRPKREDIDGVFEVESRSEIAASEIQGLFEKGTIKRSEVRKYLAKSTTLDIDQDDMDDTPPITSVTPTNDMNGDEEDPQEELEKMRLSLEELKQQVKEKIPNPRGRPKNSEIKEQQEEMLRKQKYDLMKKMEEHLS
jgi:hypothetical protein